MITSHYLTSYDFCTLVMKSITTAKAKRELAVLGEKTIFILHGMHVNFNGDFFQYSKIQLRYFLTTELDFLIQLFSLCLVVAILNYQYAKMTAHNPMTYAI